MGALEASGGRAVLPDRVALLRGAGREGGAALELGREGRRAARSVRQAHRRVVPDVAPPSLDTHRCLGYYSVRFVETLGRWVMLYTCKESSGPRGVYIRTSLALWGPWTSPILLWSPDDGYCRYMFLPTQELECSPNPHEGEKRTRTVAGAVREPGGEYAPFLLPSRYAKRLPNARLGLYFTLSTWNPYQTILLRAELGIK